MKTYYLPLNYQNLSHYFSSALICPAHYYQNRQQDIQSNFNTILISQYKWVKDCDCSLELIIDTEDENFLVETEEKELKLLSKPLPISRIKTIWLTSKENKENISYKINQGTAFIQDFLFQIEESSHFNEINIHSLNINIENFSDNALHFDNLLGGISLLSEIEANFEEITKLSFDFSLRDDNSDTTFYSLKRGVAVIENEQQLCRYMVGYSAMHKAKLLHALHKIDDKILTQVNHVVDWGCGQGMGSMVFCDYLKTKNFDFQKNKFTLVEPSKIALSRASLHLQKLTNLAEIFTINKDLDSTNKEDFIINKSVDITLHIFSNILDVELFSLSHLISLIEVTFSGINIFMCVSPYINELRTSRINSFMDNFEENLNFCLIASEDYNKGKWLKDWTMIQRIFSVKL